MRQLVLAICGVWLAATCLGGCRQPLAQQPAPPPTPPEQVTTSPPVATGTKEEATKMAWELTSPAFKDGARIPTRYTKEGEDVSPQLNWSAVPQGAVSLALICDDPDAPAGTWVHWVAYGLPPTLTGLATAIPTTDQPSELQGGKQGKNSFDKIGYGGPMPPPGKVHHYHFKLYAVSKQLDLPAGATKQQLLGAMAGSVLGEAELVGTYSR